MKIIRMHMHEKKWEQLFLILLLLYVFYLVVFLFQGTDSFQWDFRVYYIAAKTYSAGLNPYNINNLVDISQRTDLLPFVYQPITLYFFYPLTLLDFFTAYKIYLIIKILTVIYLLLLWK